MKLITDLSTFLPPTGPSPPQFPDIIELSGVASVLVVGATLVMAAHLLKTMAVEAEASLRLLRYCGLERFHFRCGGIRSVENNFGTRVR